MKNKSLFDKHLYMEGLRSTKVISGLLFVLAALFSVLFPLNVLFESFDDASYIARNAYYYFIKQNTFLYYFVIVIIVPVITLRTFSFYTTRNGSDFFHSIPHKKQCLFLSYALAALTWIAACIFIPGILSYIIYLIAGYTPINFLGLLIIQLHTLVAGLLVMSTICIACAITGTMLTNIIATGIILFWPRCLLFFIRAMLVDVTHYIIPDNSFWLGTQCNLVVDSVVNVGEYGYHLFNIRPLLYTGVLCILYFILATYLFAKRPSEIANQPTLGKHMQAALCILIGLAASLLPILFILQQITYPGESRVLTLIQLLTLYVLVILCMVVYELLTTKKVKNLLRIIPRAGILLILNVVIIVGIFASKHLILNYTPDADEISYVTGFSYSDRYDYYSDYSGSSYFTDELDSYQSENEEIKQIISKALKETVNQSRSNGGYSNFTITIKSGLGTHTRSVDMTEKEYNRVMELLKEDNDYISIYTKLPKAINSSIYIFDNMNYTNSQLTKEQLTSIYDTLKEELQTIDATKWFSNMRSGAYSNSVVLYYLVDTATNYQQVSIPLTVNLPLTYGKYMNYINENKKYSLSEYLSLVDNSTSDYVSAYINLQAMLPNSYEEKGYYTIDKDNYSDKDYKEIFDVLLQNETNKLDCTDASSYIIEISYSFYDGGNNSINYSQYISIPASDYSKISAILEKIYEY